MAPISNLAVEPVCNAIVEQYCVLHKKDNCVPVLVTAPYTLEFVVFTIKLTFDT